MKTTKTAKTTKPAAARDARQDDGRIQIVGRLPKPLSIAVRATAPRLGITLNAFMVDALTKAVAAAAKTPGGAKAPKAKATK